MNKWELDHFCYLANRRNSVKRLAKEYHAYAKKIGLSPEIAENLYNKAIKISASAPKQPFFEICVDSMTTNYVGGRYSVAACMDSFFVYKNPELARANKSIALMGFFIDSLSILPLFLILPFPELAIPIVIAIAVILTASCIAICIGDFRNKLLEVKLKREYDSGITDSNSLAQFGKEEESNNARLVSALT